MHMAFYADALLKTDEHLQGTKHLTQVT